MYDEAKKAAAKERDAVIASAREGRAEVVMCGQHVRWLHTVISDWLPSICVRPYAHGGHTHRSRQPFTYALVLRGHVQCWNLTAWLAELSDSHLIESLAAGTRRQWLLGESVGASIRARSRRPASHLRDPGTIGA